MLLRSYGTVDAKEHQEVTGLSQKLCKVSSKGKAAEVPRERTVQGEILTADVQLFPLKNLATLSEVSRMWAAVFITVIWSNWSAASFGFLLWFYYQSPLGA